MSDWNVIKLLDWTTEYFTKHQIENPRLDAEVLLAFLLNKKRIELYLEFERPLVQTELTAFKALLKRRLSGEPVSYIRGLKEFWSLPFKVGPGVLIPRPDTEVVIETIQKYRPDRDQALHIIDIGTGSGNIAIALAKEYPQATITAYEASPEAFRYAEQNVQGHEVTVTLKQADFFTQELTPKSCDILVSNPPYIATSEWQNLNPGIKNFEPQMALDAGPDGLAFYRQIGQAAPLVLKPGGLLVVEIGETQGSQVSELFQNAGLNTIEMIKDYAGLNRVVKAVTYTCKRL